ncbi:glyoxalase/bleomycin resistance protein/dioxygenase superfamily protein [Actinocorallia herbida]|uniref:Glyoxalase/bleomycin resistance protein/dioxygenase superfamily protein n=1 Tax=Actinocorallia herbida TaxID=58109 RepID=A0A3N1D534_9ACTN|nr:VOC family protein [Actinocorallia herbida]ROO88655.1 glyoxalase/bleomycin resistance protein/dioxygenase superfamily protein [Actinocorallia herbida]
MNATPPPSSAAGSVPLLAGRRICQIGILVPDLDAAVASYAAFCPAGEWRRVEPGGPMPGTSYLGEPGEFAVRLAFGGAGPEIELIESVSGPSVYSAWLETRGYGVHHLAVFVDSLAEETALMERAGFPLVQSLTGFGPYGDGGYAFYDTVAVLGHYTEALRPATR